MFKYYASLTVVAYFITVCAVFVFLLGPSVIGFLGVVITSGVAYNIEQLARRAHRRENGQSELT